MGEKSALRSPFVCVFVSFTDAPGCVVTDMLVAVLNCCTKEELAEESSDEELPAVSPTTSEKMSSDRRNVIKNKILAVGRVSRVFALLRCVLFVVVFVALTDLWRAHSQ